MGLNEGDFILIDYIARVKETGELIDTTIADVAKEENVYDENKVYEPLLVILGEHRVVRGLEEELEKMDVGVNKKFEVEPSRAYGERDPNKVKILSLREFTRRGITPKPGAIVEIGGLPAVIRSVSGGRVVTDFNHPLAGKTIVYEVKVLKKIDDVVEKIKHLVHRRMKSIPLERFEVEIIEGNVKIRMPSESYLLEDIQYAKQAIAKDIEKYISNVKSVEFIERYELAKAKESKSS